MRTIINGAIGGNRLDAGKIFAPTLKSDTQVVLIEELVGTPGMDRHKTCRRPCACGSGCFYWGDVGAGKRAAGRVTVPRARSSKLL